VLTAVPAAPRAPPPLTARRAVKTLRHIRDFFQVQFNIRPERESQTIFLSCIGTGLKNISKKIA
jgi:RNA 3'-terminal phosphate cyclase-like protein